MSKLAMESLRMSSAMFGRMFATGAYYICLQYASEIFPTSIRGSGLSACEIIGGIGLFMSPWIVYLVRNLRYHHGHVNDIISQRSSSSLFCIISCAGI